MIISTEKTIIINYFRRIIINLERNSRFRLYVIKQMKKESQIHVYFDLHAYLGAKSKYIFNFKFIISFRIEAKFYLVHTLDYLISTEY